MSTKKPISRVNRVETMQVEKPTQELREAKTVIRLGKKGVGKTFQTMKFFSEKYIIDFPGKKGRKVLIFDTNSEFVNVDPIRFQDVILFMHQKVVEMRRILPIHPDTGKPLGIDDKVKLLEDLLDDVKIRGLGLYLEDINSYMTGATSKKMINLLTTNRHNAIDLFLNFQTFRAVPPRIYGNINILILHKTNDSAEEVKNKVPNYKITQIANNLVDIKFKENPRFFAYIDYDINKIYGEFKKSELIEAIEKYVLENESRRIKSLAAVKGKKPMEITNEIVSDYYYEYSLDNKKK